MVQSKYRDKDPYIKKLEDLGPISVWLVDGNYIRAHLQPQFTVEAHWMDKDYKNIIPKGEFWLDTGMDPAEYDFFLVRMLEEVKHRSNLIPEIRSEELASEAEKRERARARGVRSIPKSKPDVERNLIYTVKVDYQKDPILIYVVDGRVVRDQIDILWRHGGHDLVYPEYVPKNHTWVDNTTKRKEWDYFLVHELFERKEMYGGKKGSLSDNYKKAHAKALRVEQKCRHDYEYFQKMRHEVGLD